GEAVRPQRPERREGQSRARGEAGARRGRETERREEQSRGTGAETRRVLGLREGRARRDREGPGRVEVHVVAEDADAHCGCSAAVSYSSTLAARRTISSAARTAFCACAGYGVE